MAVGSFKLPNVTASAPVDPSGWTRPSDWLAMPTIGTQEFIGLLAVTDDSSNHIALTCQGAYTVDWGDGVTENVATNVKAQHTYTYSTISSGSLSARGYKQVLVRVTPQSGQNLTKIDLQQQNSILAKAHSMGWLDIAIKGANITTMTLGGSTVYQSMCENVDIYSMGAITNFTTLFSNFYTLQKLTLPSTTAVTNFFAMFQNCRSLITVPLFSTASGITFSSMFTGCYSLQSIPSFNTGAGTLFDSMFLQCYSLKSIPLLNTALATTVSGMFQNCISLRTIPALVTTLSTSFFSMFDGCYSLQSVPLINTVAGLDFRYMFQQCQSLQLLPNLNTAVGTQFLGVVSLSPSIAKAAFQGTRYAISYANMCLSQTEIVNIFYGLGTAVGTPTITISTNPGYAAVTAPEKLIATTKGWTIA